ncbi:MBL fold metallo-hydrolase [Aquipuribacter sp. SD81]|uniref:MBL fold metallo-hydrolase n=1 Tax=Aquipuribacter sp. SD81 TaxID=3127703 RepID=UPI0030199C54
MTDTHGLEPVADGVLVHRSALLANNAVVVDGPTGVLLVDPGLTASELTCLADDLARSGRRVVAGFATHPDWDHVLWHEALGDVPRYGTTRCVEQVRSLRADPAWRERVAEGLPSEIADEVPVELYGLLTALPARATRVPWDGPPVRVIEHPAHSPGHAALLVEDAGVLVAGDMLSDVLPPMPDDSDDPLGEYLAGLDALDGVADRVRAAVPGHGSVAVGEEVRARLALDRAVVKARRDGRSVADPRVDSPAPGWEWVTDAFGPGALSRPEG